LAISQSKNQNQKAISNWQLAKKSIEQLVLSQWLLALGFWLQKSKSFIAGEDACAPLAPPGS
jgi:hypothetical protein